MNSKRLRRIIVALPFLNIIRQTTKELREVQATDPVIKSEKEDADGYNKERPLRQLAVENWDAS